MEGNFMEDEDLNEWARNNGEPIRIRGALRLAVLERGENPDRYNDDWLDPDDDDAWEDFEEEDEE
jgi:hypothetical protein